MGKAQQVRYVGGGCRYVFLTFFCNLGELFLFCKTGITMHLCFSKVPLSKLMKCYIQPGQDKSLYLLCQSFLFQGGCWGNKQNLFLCVTGVPKFMSVLYLNMQLYVLRHTSLPVLLLSTCAFNSVIGTIKFECWMHKGENKETF